MTELKLGDIAPNFTSEATVGIFNLYNYMGSSWYILFFYPADFAPVCITELREAAKKKLNFEQRNLKVLEQAFSVVPKGWKKLKSYLRIILNP